MQIRPQPLSNLAQHFLDGASENEEMLGAAATWLALYGDRHLIETAVDNLPPQCSWKDRLAVALHLQGEAFRDASSAEQPWREAFLSSAALSGRRVLAGAADFYACWNYEDSIWGGCALPFKRAGRPSRRWGWKNPEPTPKVARRLRSRRAIAHYIAAAAETAEARRRVLADLVAGPIVFDENAARLFSLEWERAVHAWRIAQSARARIEQVYAAERRSRGWTTARVIPHAKRKPLLRAARIATQVVGAPAVRDFVAGRQVILPGDQFLFRIERGGAVDKAGHGALSISLIDPQSQQRLAGLCLYFDKTPALDQLAAVGLHLAAGDEGSLVETGNLYAIEPAGVAHPALSARVRTDARQTILGNSGDPTHAMRFFAARYALEMFPVYQDVLADMTVGRRKKDLLACGSTPQDIVRAA